MSDLIRFKSWGRVAAFGLLLGALSACDGLLEVDIPHILTDAALEGPATAETQVNSMIAQIECGTSVFAYIALGHEDVHASVAGIGGNNALYRSTPDTGGGCDTSSANGNWFDQFMAARAGGSRDPALFPLALQAEGDSRGVYDRIQNDPDWQASLGGAEGEKLSAIAALYVAIALTHFGEFYCEIGIDGSEPMGPDAVLTMAGQWIDRAFTHMSSDFVMPFSISTSAHDMGYALRARIKWAQGDLAGANTEAAKITEGWTAWITRESGEQRRNKIFHAAQSVSFAGMVGQIDWWDSGVRSVNPATNALWPTTIPFTGYIFLGISPEGQTVDAAGYPMRWAKTLRDASDDPISLGNSATPDPRVTHAIKSVQGPGRFEVLTKYKSEGDDIPLVGWKEMVLIEAEYDMSTGALAAAIAHVNIVRAATEATLISGGHMTTLLGSQAHVRKVIIEERRRALFAEGARYWSTKIQNTDLLWFPRAEGQTTFQAYPLGGGVRLEFVGDEYDNNQHWVDAGGDDLKGTLCAADEAPIIL